MSEYNRGYTQHYEGERLVTVWHDKVKMLEDLRRKLGPYAEWKGVKELFEEWIREAEEEQQKGKVL